MLNGMKRVAKGVHRRAFRATRRLASALEPRDPSHLASRLDHGDIVWRAFLEAGVALRGSGRFAEADAMVERALAAFPGERTFLVEHALNAHNSGRYAEAIARWEEALKRFPNDAMCCSGLAANLRATGDTERAAKVVGEALRAHPDDLVVVTEAARVAERRGDDEGALALWRRANAAGPPHVEWLQGEIQALVRLARLPEAERLLAFARAGHPDQPALLAAGGLLASAKADWHSALALWSEYGRRVPDDPIALHHIAEAKVRLATAGPHGAAIPPSVVDQTETRALLLGFESIGDGCEFGFLQRRFGADPPGLMRWSTTGLHGLISALHQRFEGLGRPENTEILSDEIGDEVIRDRRWNLGLQADLTLGDATGPLQARLESLQARFLADLAEARKTIVFCSAGIEDEGLDALHGALERFGPVRLLNVQPAAPTAPTSFAGQAGEVIAVGRHRWVGFVERLDLGTRDGAELAVEDWLSVCRKTAAFPR